jgi:hypothetical protein
MSLQRYHIYEPQRTDRHGEADGRFSQFCEKRLQTEVLGGPHTSGGQTPGLSSCKVQHPHFVMFCCTSFKHSARTLLTRCALEYAPFVHLYLAGRPDELTKLKQGISAPRTSGALPSPPQRAETFPNTGQSVTSKLNIV